MKYEVHIEVRDGFISIFSNKESGECIDSERLFQLSKTILSLRKVSLKVLANKLK